MGLERAPAPCCRCLCGSFCPTFGLVGASGLHQLPSVNHPGTQQVQALHRLPASPPQGGEAEQIGGRVQRQRSGPEAQLGQAEEGNVQSWCLASQPPGQCLPDPDHSKTSPLDVACLVLCSL